MPAGPLTIGSLGAAGDPGGTGIHSSLLRVHCPWQGSGGYLLNEIPSEGGAVGAGSED